MLLGYAPSGTQGFNMGTQTIRRGLVFKGTSRLSAAQSLATTRTSIRFSSGAFASLMPLQVRYKTNATLRISQEPSNSLASGYGDTASAVWTEWENCVDCYLFNRPMFGRASVQGAPLLFEIQAVRRVANGAQ